jgi:hypothetical protein
LSLLQRATSLIGKSVYEGFVKAPGFSLDSDMVTLIRQMLGGNLQTLSTTRLEWFLEDVDIASQAADLGDLEMAAHLTRAMRRDPVISGLLATKSGGITRLPKMWFGSERVREELDRNESGQTVFDHFCPQTELRQMADDADFLKVSLAELVPVQGRRYPVLERKDPKDLFYLWPFGCWIFRSVSGIIPVTPGDGRWVLHLSGPRVTPWQYGNWHPAGRAWVRKDSNQALKDNWAFHLANAARVAVSPQGSTPAGRANWFQQIASWGINSVFHTLPGYDAKLLESNGIGWEGFDSTIKECNEAFMIQFAGQLVSVTGGTGFSSEDLYASVRYDLIEDTAVPLAHTISTQALPWFTAWTFPEEIDDSPGYKYDVRRPTDLSAEASIYTALGAGIESLVRIAAVKRIGINVGELLQKFGVPNEPIEPEQADAIIAALEKLGKNAKVNDNAGQDAKATKAMLYTLGKAIDEQRSAA